MYRTSTIETLTFGGTIVQWHPTRTCRGDEQEKGKEKIG